MTYIIEGLVLNNGAAVLTLPTATDTIVARATTETLTNKTIAFASNTLTGTQASLSGTFNLANFTDPGNGTASAAVAGTIGTFVFGYITYTPNTATDQTQTFQVETGVGTGVYTTVKVTGIVANVSNVGGATMNGFNFFVPTGRKWKHNVSGTAAVTSLSAIVL